MAASICMTILSACGGSSGGGTPSAYTIGVNVSGLSGSGLVLQLNAGSDLTVTVDGNATFATAVPSGTRYKVIVKTQPSSPSQTCTVANDSGMIANANVTGIAIICVTASYTVGVTVSGLSGFGLVLQLNGGADLSIISNGKAMFSAAINSGASYAVIVKTQPTLPSQSCTVTNGSGTIGTADVTNVAITCVASSSGGGAPAAATMLYFSAGTEYGSLGGGKEGWLSSVIGYPANSSGPLSPTITITSLNLTDRYFSVATDSFGYIYVGAAPAFGGSTGEVLVFAPTASGMAMPVRTIAVPSKPGAMALDAAGNVYVTTSSYSTSSQNYSYAILEFAAGANGNVAPLRNINLAAACVALAVDRNGNIVCVPYSPNGSNEILLFTSGQSGNATPARTISLAGNLQIFDLSLDPLGNIYVATHAGFDGPVNILELQGGADGIGTGSPVAGISEGALAANVSVGNIGFDAAGNLYVFGMLPSTTNQGVVRFTLGPNGFASPISEILIPPPSPIYFPMSIIAGFTVH